MATIYKISLILIFSFAIIVFILLFFVSAPYGKFSRKGWGPAVKSKWAWMIMEFPSPLLMFILFLFSDNKKLPQVIFLCLWMGHYIYRTFFYPFRQSGREKAYPVLILSMAFVFNCFNGFVNGYGIFHVNSYSDSNLIKWQFITGFIFFVGGFIVNNISDEKLSKLKMTNSAGYVIPKGWLFNYISNPHYFGEMIEWTGWAIMTWSLPGLAFAVFTSANLFPRALDSHKWYKKEFRNYPPERKAIIPFII